MFEVEQPQIWADKKNFTPEVKTYTRTGEGVASINGRIEYRDYDNGYRRNGSHRDQKRNNSRREQKWNENRYDEKRENRSFRDANNGREGGREGNFQSTTAFVGDARE